MGSTAFNTALGPGDPDDGDAGRKQRGLAIALMEKNIRPDRMGYKVPSQSGNGAYLVSLEDGPYCSCPDWEKREGSPCKHIYAVLALRQEVDVDAPAPTAPRYPQPVGYDAAQVYEGELFARLLRDLCNTVEQPPQSTGRPRLPLGDMICGMGLKVYSTLSTRRAMSELREAVEQGRMQREPSYSTAIRYFEREDITPVLRDLIRASALPLREIEHCFAIDSSGFASTAYQRWFDYKYGNKKGAKWVKVHLMCGVLSNIVTVADAIPTQSADVRFMPDFVRATAEYFQVHEVSADMAYSSRENLHAVEEVGGTAYIPFKKSAIARNPKKPDALWEQMYHLFTLNEAEFNRHYHKRSNVETVFHMLKAKFGDRVRAKTDTAQVNEALMKVLCHNICVLIRVMYTLGVTPVFDHRTFSSETAVDAKALVD